MFMESKLIENKEVKVSDVVMQKLNIIDTKEITLKEFKDKVNSDKTLKLVENGNDISVKRLLID